MNEQEFCQGCDQKQNCQDVYRQLGEDQCPPVAFKAVVAFLLPIIVFVASLAACEKILTGSINSTGLRNVISCLAALAVTFVVILIIRVRGKKF